AAMALLVRVAIGLSTTAAPAAATAPAAAIHSIQAHTVANQESAASEAGRTQLPAFKFAAVSMAVDPSFSFASLSPVRKFIVVLLAIMAAVTCTFGNLAAYGQTNIKRLLAYSTIAHAGYMIMSVAAAVQLMGSDAIGARDAIAALMFYLAVYVFM